MTDTESKSMTEISPIDRIFCAVDTPKLDDALMLADLLAGEVGAIKLGKEFFTAHGPDGVKRVADCGHKIFLDLKFHDIPNTVASRSVTALPRSSRERSASTLSIPYCDTGRRGEVSVQNASFSPTP